MREFYISAKRDRPMNAIPSWFLKVDQLLDLIERSKIKDFKFNDDGIEVTVADAYSAGVLWESYKIISPLHLTIFDQKGRKFATTRFDKSAKIETAISRAAMLQLQSISQSDSTWAKQNPGLLDMLPGTRFIYRADDNLTCLLALPEISTGRLNRPDCIGKPLLYLDHEISMPRKKAIEEAIASPDGTAKYYYEHHWQGLTWRFRGKVLVLPSGEVLTIVEDNPDDSRAAWQRGYWLATLPD